MPAGRKGKFEYWLTEDGLLTLKGYARDGLSDKQIYEDKLDISYTTFYEWVNRFPEFRDAIKKGREPVSVKVEDAFYSRCEWREVTDETVEEYRDADGNIKERHVKKVKKMIAPDTAALIFALKNLRPDKWRDKVPLEQVNDGQLAKAKELLGGIESAID